MNVRVFLISIEILTENLKKGNFRKKCLSLVACLHVFINVMKMVQQRATWETQVIGLVLIYLINLIKIVAIYIEFSHMADPLFELGVLERLLLNWVGV